MTAETMLKSLGRMERHMIDTGPHHGRMFVMLDIRINVDGSGVINAMTRDWSPDESPIGTPDPMRMLRSVFADWVPYLKFDNLNQLECILLSYREQEPVTNNWEPPAKYNRGLDCGGGGRAE